MKFEDSVTYTLIQSANAYRSYLEKLMSEIGLHSGQVFVLISLWRSEGQSQTDLVKNLNLRAPTINKMVKSLVKSGYVECRKCPVDGRLTRIFLTDKGAECESLVAEQWQKVELQSHLTLTDTERLIFAQLFLKLRENLHCRI